MTRIPIDDSNDPNVTPAPEGSPEPAAQGEHGQQGAAAPSGDVSAALRAERDDLYNRLARTTADFKNSQKRLQAEFDQRVVYANQSLIKSLLPVIDNFERALAVDAAKTDAKVMLKGLQLVHDQWISVLKQQQVAEIAPAPGDPFDATAGMEAVMQQPAPPELAGKGQVVVQLFAKGYKLGDRVLRPAQVAVSQS
ncbi:MAG: heat shock protein GrpE [Phycisphaerales bacterium]|nr:heat shock protein GrpE [Phycisphaerales bacterium]